MTPNAPEVPFWEVNSDNVLERRLNEAARAADATREVTGRWLLDGLM
jgi:hypothetical protein